MSEDKTIEEELSALTGIQVTKYPDRQDYLAALLRAVEKLPDSDYDGMTEHAFQWYKQGVLYHNHRKPIPDFPDTASGDVNDVHLATSVEELQAGVQGSEGDGTKAKGGTTKRKLPPRRVPDYENLSGEVDRYGITIGTNTHEAVKMYEKGCSVKDIENALGGTYRNILKKLRERGHKVDQLGVGQYKVTHKDDV